MAALLNIGISINPGRQTSGALYQRMNPMESAISIADHFELSAEEQKERGISSGLIFGLLTLGASLCTLIGLT